MQALKLIFILFITVYAQDPDFDNTNDAESEASDLLAILADRLMREVNELSPQIDVLNEILVNTVTLVLHDAKDNLEAYLTSYKEDIEKLQYEAAEADVDVTEYIRSKIGHINSLQAQVLKKISICVDSIVIATEEKIEQSTRNILSTADVLKALADQKDICGKEISVDQVECFTKVSANITENITTLTTQIIDEGVTVQTVVYSAVPEIVRCGERILAVLNEVDANNYNVNKIFESAQPDNFD